MTDLIRKITPVECKETVAKSQEHLIKERSLIKFQIWNNIRNQSRNNRLGVAWLVLNPLVSSLIYVFVLTVMRANLNAMNILIGITMFNVFSVAVRSGVSSIQDYRGGIYAERISSRVLTRGMLGSRIVNTHFQTLGAAVVLIVMFDVHVIKSASLILISILFGIITEGFMLNFAKLIRNIPDLNNIIQYIVQLLFFTSPVLYEFSQTDGAHEIFNSFNPVMYFIEVQRGIISEEFNFDGINRTFVFFIMTFLVILSIRGYRTIDKVRWEVSSWS